jgi:hypothetical protein
MPSWHPYVGLGSVGRNMKIAPDFEIMVLECSDSCVCDTDTDDDVAMQYRPTPPTRILRKRKRDYSDFSAASVSMGRVAKKRETIDLTLDDD